MIVYRSKFITKAKGKRKAIFKKKKISSPECLVSTITFHLRNVKLFLCPSNQGETAAIDKMQFNLLLYLESKI